MKKIKTPKHWKAVLAALMALTVYATCAGPLRALLNWHEQQHLFRWTGAYFQEMSTTSGGWTELAVSLDTQCFYKGWLGALVIALLSVILLSVLTGIMRLCRLRHSIFYIVAIAMTLWMTAWVLIPKEYIDDDVFRETLEYDYLVRNRKWDKIINTTRREPPKSLNGVWCTNYALARKGILCDSLFYFPQQSPEGLLLDAQRVEQLSLFSMGDIFFQLGLVNDAERMAFDARQLLNRKSGRLYQRLALCNIINGDSAIANKYLGILKTSLFYGSWAREMAGKAMQDIDDPLVKQLRQWRVKGDSTLSPQIPHKLGMLVSENPDNWLARDYLMAYQLLRLDFNSVLDLERQTQHRQQRVPPLAVQECIIGNWVLTHPNDSFPVPITQGALDLTMRYIQKLNATGNALDPSFNAPPYVNTYWHYHATSQEKINRQ